MGKDFYYLFVRGDEKFGIAQRKPHSNLISLKDGIWADHHLALFPQRWLFSEKAKRIIDSYVNVEDKVVWEEVLVEDENSDKKNYFLMSFSDNDDVIDKRSVDCKDNRLVLDPVFSYEKIKMRNIFSYRGTQCCLIVSEGLKSAIEENSCSNILFQPAKTTFRKGSYKKQTVHS